MKNMFIFKVILVSVILSMVASGCSFNSKTKQEKQITNVSLPKEDTTGMVEFKLYFGEEGKDSKGVKPEERSVKRDELLGSALLNELIKGPAIKSSLKPVLPQDTKVLNFSIRDKVGYVNVDGKVLEKIKEDEENGKAIIASIVFTMCQLPEVDKVQFMFDNQKSDIKVGNIEIKDPLLPEMFK